MKSTSSNHRLKITINGKLYLVEVEDLSASPITVKVNGQAYLVDVETSGAEVASLNETATTETGSATPRMETPDRIAPPPTLLETGARQVRAPMPGHIVEIMVQPGDAVRVGQELCSLEAMKMKNAVRSIHNGVVASVEVSLGQAVAYGDILVTLEQGDDGF